MTHVAPRSWIWLAAPWVAVLGCSQPAQVRQDPVPTPGDAHLKLEELHVTDTPAAHDGGPRSVGNADIVGPRAFDARVIWKDQVSERELRFVISYPGDVEPGLITEKWTGAFLSDGKPIASTDFKITSARNKEVRAVIAAARLPSERVRLYEPGYSR